MYLITDSLAEKQQTVNRLLYRTTEPLRFDELEKAAANFHPDADKSIYKDGGAAVERLMKEMNDHRLLEKHHWFSLFNPRQREEALMLFEVLINCNDWDTAVNNAAYFREHMNEGEFVYAIYATVIHSKLGEGIVLPPLYEVTPHMFTNSEVIQKAYTAQMTQTPGKFKMEFTGSKKNPEQHVAYFGEDIGMNVHHVTWHLDFPFWWNDDFGYHLDQGFNFRQNIRNYNSAFAFASFSANIRHPPGRGQYCFGLQGQTYHYASNLHADDTEERRYSQEGRIFSF
ncbi:Hemocyanin N-terminal [Trinorchestia longiramus]|nr:Hemocyanin N-terminal [Trinorchestia longiramus]